MSTKACNNASLVNVRKYQYQGIVAEERIFLPDRLLSKSYCSIISTAIPKNDIWLKSQVWYIENIFMHRRIC